MPGCGGPSGSAERSSATSQSVKATAPPATIATPTLPTFASPSTVPLAQQAPAGAPCPNGTYVNSAGNTECSPFPSPSGPPPGATALCGDGTYSFSRSRPVACSGHGGVVQWL
ncbi:MAG TPA: DUF3761 domain-containing protein [Acidimicrobiia bacterium]|nr:DUF3761 domain-containing protein [Acidimicrobiia bacterium]